MASIDELKRVEPKGPWVMLIDGPASLPSRTSGERADLERVANFLIQSDSVLAIAIVTLEELNEIEEQVR